IAFGKSWVTVKPYHHAMLIDRGRCVPKLCSQVPNVSHSAIAPNHRVDCRVTPDRLIADSRDPDRDMMIIDRRRRARTVTGKQRQLANLVSIRSVNHRPKLKHLWRNTKRVMTGVLRPAHHLAEVIRPRGEAIVPAQSRQGTHLSVLVNETKAD